MRREVGDKEADQERIQSSLTNDVCHKGNETESTSTACGAAMQGAGHNNVRTTQTEPATTALFEEANVRIHGLTSEEGKKLNGNTGVCQKFLEKTGRWKVALNIQLSPGINEIKQIKPENLQLMIRKATVTGKERCQYAHEELEGAKSVLAYLKHWLEVSTEILALESDTSSERYWGLSVEETRWAWYKSRVRSCPEGFFCPIGSFRHTQTLP